MDDGRQRGRESDPAEAGGKNNYGDSSSPLFCLLPLALCRDSYNRNHMAVKKKIFPGESGKKTGRGGKKSIFFPGIIDGGGTVVCAKRS